MRVYVSVDMEGIAGVNHPVATDRADSRYPEKVGLMVAETNAAIEGAIAGGATEVVVNDSHGDMHNLLAEPLHPAALVVQGQKAWSMVAAADPAAGGRSVSFSGEEVLEPFGVALFVGYHARAGHPTGTISHTYSSRPVLTRLDGRLVGETGLNALVLGAWGIPVGLVTGDDALAEEVREWLPWAERVVVKHGVGRHAAESLHPSVARDLVRGGAERAVRRATAGELRPLVLEPPISVELELAEPVGADYAAIVPGGERFGDRGVRFVSDDPVTAYRSFLAAVRLASLTHR